ncbi:MAG TPA: divergent polysaccharide deacetylase family protein, partial [Candidatus Acidoferrales bacterium]|nr:divergent polysaccharide deacetylase family protein [Candidatus Acidoferrales bacterium]
ALPAPVGFAVKPSRPFSGLVAERARLADREVLVDLPIDVESAREKVAARPTPEDGAQDALTQLLDTWLEAVPQATGAAGELTARYSQNRQHLQNMIEHLKQKNVFVVDRGPGSQSIACDLAQSLREPCIVENDRLDDNADEAALRKQLATVREQARLRGSVVVGALARPALIAALRAELPAFANEQVEVVSLSETMAPSALSRR